MEKKQKSFVLYADFESALLKLSIKERGIPFTMIYSYANRGYVDTCDKIPPLVEMAFAVLRAQLDRDREKYEKICARNAKNGMYGGRPKKQEKTQWVFEKPKKPYNDNYNDNKNDNNSDIDSVIDSDSDNELVIGRSFDVEDFFDAAVKRAYGEEEKKDS